MIDAVIAVSFFSLRPRMFEVAAEHIAKELRRAGHHGPWFLSVRRRGAEVTFVGKSY